MLYHAPHVHKRAFDGSRTFSGTREMLGKKIPLGKGYFINVEKRRIKRKPRVRRGVFRGPPSLLRGAFPFFETGCRLFLFRAVIFSVISSNINPADILHQRINRVGAGALVIKRLFDDVVQFGVELVFRNTPLFN